MQGFHTRDGYGDLEALIQVEELDHADMLDLQEFFSDDNPVVPDLVVNARASVTPGDEVESVHHSIQAQREMGTLLSEYGVDRLAERTFSTASVLHRVLDRYRRVRHQLDASPSQSRQDATRAKYQLHIILRIRSGALGVQTSTERRCNYVHRRTISRRREGADSGT